ncbi:MAG: hypothetical protein ACI4IX_05750, partial [Acutalibacteraceae bacterium]
ILTDFWVFFDSIFSILLQNFFFTPSVTAYAVPPPSSGRQINQSAFAEQLQSVIGGAYPQFAKQTSFLRQQKLHVPQAHFILHLFSGGRTQFAPNGVADDFCGFHGTPRTAFTTEPYYNIKKTAPAEDLYTSAGLIYSYSSIKKCL